MACMLPRPSSLDRPLIPCLSGVCACAWCLQAVTAATQAWFAAIRAKQEGVAVQGLSHQAVREARGAARRAVTVKRADARDAWNALIARGKSRTLSGERAGLTWPGRTFSTPTWTYPILSLVCLCPSFLGVPAVGPIATLVSDDAPLLLPLRLRFVSLCLAFLNNGEGMASRVSEKRAVALEWVKALLEERPVLLHAYTNGQHGKTRQDRFYIYHLYT